MRLIIIILLLCTIIVSGCESNAPLYNNSTIQLNNTIVQEKVAPIVMDITPIISVDGIQIIIPNLTIVPETPYTIRETIQQGVNRIVDAECELDIINAATIEKIIEFRSFYNNDGIMEYTWIYPIPGTFILQQYCTGGEVLDQNKIYSNTSIIVK